MDKEISERGLVDRIIHLHEDLGLGFRRVARELTAQGFTISKDKARRLYCKHRKPNNVNTEENAEVKQLTILEEKIEKRTKVANAKNEKRRRIATLLSKEADMDFERRKRLFEDKVELVDFAEKVLPVTNPAIWLRLTNFCAEEQNDLANALQNAIGNQADYEEVRREYRKEGRDYFLDEYFCLRIEDWLQQRGAYEETEETLSEQEEEYEFENEPEENEWEEIILPSGDLLLRIAL